MPDGAKAFRGQQHIEPRFDWWGSLVNRQLDTPHY